MTGPAQCSPARHIAIVQLFLDLVNEVAGEPSGGHTDYETKLLDALDWRAVAGLAESVAMARGAMMKLAPAVLAGN